VETTSEGTTMNEYSYQGPLGDVSHCGRYFFAWKGGFLVGAYQTVDEAMASLVWKERLKTKPLAEEIRAAYLRRSSITRNELGLRART
jgi:hypothetical protein